MTPNPPRLRPADMQERLSHRVVGQPEALREVAVTLVKHLMGHRSGSVLLIGHSGSGKTTLMRAIEGLLREPEIAGAVPVIRVNASVLAEAPEGYGNVLMRRLWDRAEHSDAGVSRTDRTARIGRGIVFVDEVDKIRAQIGGSPNVRGIIAQETLLTLMENESLEFDPGDGGGRVTIDSSGLLFIAGGAFEEMYDSVYRRAVSGSDDTEPLRPITVVSQTGEAREEIPFHLRNYLRYDDLFRYGMLPQFVSRFESITVLNDLGERDLARIFVEPDDSPFRQSRRYFARFGVDLQITRNAILLLAWHAARQKKLGARAIAEAWRRIIRELEFDPPRDAGKAGTTDDGRPIVRIEEDLVRRALRPVSS